MENFLYTALARIIFSTTSFLQQEAILAAILFVFLLPLSIPARKKSPYLLYGIWVLFFLRLILPVDLSSPWSARSLLGRSLNSLGSERSAGGVSLESSGFPVPSSWTAQASAGLPPCP